MSARLLCVGDVGLDHVIRVPRLPGRDEKIGRTLVARGLGGMAANVAVGASRLGTAARMAATTGDDAMGQEVRNALQDEGVDMGFVKIRAGLPTFFCMILVDASGEKALVRAEGAAFLPDAANLAPAAFDGIAHAHLIHPEPQMLRRARDLARQNGATLSLDLEAADLPLEDEELASVLSQVDILFLGRQCRAMIDARLGQIRVRDGQMILTTRGADGVMLEDGAGSTEIGGHALRPVDTLGAGDAFAAAFLHAWLGGDAPRAALRFANAAGALATQAYGAQSAMARPQDIEALLADPGRLDA